MHTILVVDDDPTVAEVVTGYLERAGFAVDRAADGPEALRLAATSPPALVVLDLMLPGMDGLEVCRRLRAHAPVPVIMLTARGDEDDRILGLEVGADDYVTKPFSPRELVLRVESVLRRGRTGGAGRPSGPVLRRAGLALDPAARRVTKGGHVISLTLREFDLLAHLMRHPGRAIDRETLMREVWGWDFGDLSTVTVHVRRLRGKIEDDPAKPRLIQTVWGVGYRFDTPPATDPPPGADATPVRGDGEAFVRAEGVMPIRGEDAAPVKGDGATPAGGDGAAAVRRDGPPVRGDGAAPVPPGRSASGPSDDPAGIPVPVPVAVPVSVRTSEAPRHA
ncbi:response regulator transcription factor [Streptomyces sp. GMY02]|uniref:response regulator transcription factor n=1 Tax=Streptomyces sp. GMY02 TaxID=1333528 RepID=UPI001C2BD332|nr:response regulator transcription factor [Streptomyces sp. GMY02]QXE34115.1 response regulator transcription factor [Streptomyces sp. GMY02]